jgi:cytoskeletal protein CcmA (bactofilin family)
MPESSTRQGRPTPGPLMISRGVTIVGSLFYDGQIQVEGTIDGEVRCSALQITELGAVEGLIVAESVDVRGEANGSIYAEKLVLRTACAVQGEVYNLVWRTAAYSRVVPGATQIRWSSHQNLASARLN